MRKTWKAAVIYDILLGKQETKYKARDPAVPFLQKKCLFEWKCAGWAVLVQELAGFFTWLVLLSHTLCSKGKKRYFCPIGNLDLVSCLYWKVKYARNEHCVHLRSSSL